MTPAPSVAAALSAVMTDCDHVAKRDRNTHQNFAFRGIDAVLNAVGPVLRKHKVIVVPRIISSHYETVQTTTGKPATACRVEVSYVFYGPSGDSIASSVIGEAWDSGDKAAPKAMSVAFRTALLQALALPTDEPDPDSQTYERSAPQPQSDLASLKRQVWEQAQSAGNTDEERKAYIAAALAARGLASDEAGLSRLLKDWAEL